MKMRWAEVGVGDVGADQKAEQGAVLELENPEGRIKG